MTEEKFDLCAYCCGWVSSLDGKTPLAVCEAYPKMMHRVLKEEFGIPKKAAADFVDNACYGNWLKLHETDVERRASVDTYADLVLSDVFYSSDRWSWDRVLRIQWLYMRLRDRLERMQP